jgi:hypothetical protein
MSQIADRPYSSVAIAGDVVTVQAPPSPPLSNLLRDGLRPDLVHRIHIYPHTDQGEESGLVIMTDREWSTTPRDSLMPNMLGIPAITGGGDLRTEIPIDLTGRRRTAVTISNLQLIAAPEILTIPEDFVILGRKAELYFGAVNDDTDRHIRYFSGVISSVSTDDARLSLSFDLLEQFFNRPALSVKFAATGLGEGDAGLREVNIPRVFGSVFFMEPILEDSARQIYRVSLNDVLSIDRVYDRGVELQFDGVIHDDLQAFYSASVANGFYSIGPRARFKLGAPPQGAVRCDVRGEFIDLLYRQGARDILNELIKEAVEQTNLIFLSGTISVIANDDVGLVITGTQTWQDIIDLILRPYLGFLDVNPDGEVMIGVMRNPETSSADLFIDESHIFRVTTRTASTDIVSIQDAEWSRNWAPLSPSELVDPSSPQISSVVYERAQQNGRLLPIPKVNDETLLAYPFLAVERTLPTLFTSQNPADAAAERVAEFYKTANRLIFLSVDLSLFRSLIKGRVYSIRLPDINKGTLTKMSLFQVNPSVTRGVVEAGFITRQ